MRRLLPLLIALLCLSATPAAAVGTVTQVASVVGSVNSLTQDVTGAGITSITPGSSIYVIVAVLNTATAVSVTDDEATPCVYSLAGSSVGAYIYKIYVFRCDSIAAAPATKITANWATTQNKALIAVVQATGMAAASSYDTIGSPVGSAGSGQSTFTTAPVTPALACTTELAIGATLSSASAGTWTPSSGFTALAGAGISSGNPELHTEKATVSSAVTFSPSWTTTTRTVGGDVWTFKDNACPVGGVRHGLTLVRVG